MYDYMAQITKIIDGDTVDAIIDLGFDVKLKRRVRLAGIDTPELNSKNPQERQAAKIARDYLKSLLKSKEIYLKSEKVKWDKYNRYVAYIYVIPNEYEVTVSKIMFDKGLAKPYYGGKKEEWTDTELQTILSLPKSTE